jgi:putative phosphoribosyl transferase
MTTVRAGVQRVTTEDSLAPLPYPDRQTAGRELASLLRNHADDPHVVVLALPRGGLPVASEVARALRVPLDVLVVRKLGLPWQPELAAGAIACGGIMVTNPQVAAYFPNLEKTLEDTAARERHELQRRESLYRKGHAPLDVRDRVVILVDDGIATGSTMEAAALALRAMHARSIVVAVPVAPAESIEMLARHADRVVCAHQPESFIAVGRWYQDFPQLTDDEVVTILAQHRGPSSGKRAAAGSDQRRGH